MNRIDRLQQLKDFYTSTLVEGGEGNSFDADILCSIEALQGKYGADVQPSCWSDRPSWSEYFLQIARVVATRSTCPQRTVGAVIVRDKRIIATGYNGALPNALHCLDVGCLIENEKCVRARHAEANAISQAAKYGIPLDGSTLVCTCRPCETFCTDTVISSGIRCVIFEGQEPVGRALANFHSAGVELLQKFEGKWYLIGPNGKWDFGL